MPWQTDTVTRWVLYFIWWCDPPGTFQYVMTVVLVFYIQTHPNLVRELNLCEKRFDHFFPSYEQSNKSLKLPPAIGDATKIISLNHHPRLSGRSHQVSLTKFYSARKKIKWTSLRGGNKHLLYTCGRFQYVFSPFPGETTWCPKMVRAKCPERNRIIEELCTTWGLSSLQKPFASDMWMITWFVIKFTLSETNIAPENLASFECHKA